MRQQTALHLIVMASIFAGAPLAAFAQPAATAAQPAAADSVEQGKKALTRARAAYAALKSYKESFEIRWQWKSEDGPSQDVSHNGTNAWAAPDKLRSESKEAAVVCDGKTMVMHDIAGKMYKKTPQPPGADLMDALAEFPQGQWLMSSTGSLLMRNDANPELLFRSLTKVTGSKPETRDGVAGLTVEGLGVLDPDNAAPDETPTKITMWFRDSDGLLGRFQMDSSEASSEQQEVEYDVALWTCTFSDIQVNTEIPPETFVFTPKDSDREVEDFMEDMAMGFEEPGSQNQLIGSPAPALGASDLDGKTVSLEEYRGRVVVLDFWATWCPPCVAAMPHVQKVSEKYADKPVTILGINGDQGDTEKVEKFIDSKKITFRQVMDDGTIGQSYLVRGIPCTVLIDKEGVVQHVETGFHGADALADKIDRLLEGKPVHTPEEIAEFKAAADREKNAPRLAFEEADAERLVDAGRVGQGFFHQYQSRVIDIDSDGKPEVVIPSQNGIQYIDETGSSVKTIRMKGLGQAYVNAFEPVRLDGKVHWLVSCMKPSGDPQEQSTVFALLDHTGQKLWSFTPDVPESTFVQSVLAAGDLTGDGEPEIVVGLQGTRRRDGDLDFSPKNQAGAIIVLNRKGERLAQRNFNEQVNYVFIGAPVKPGEPSTLAVALDQRVQKLTFDLKASGAAKKEVRP